MVRIGDHTFSAYDSTAFFKDLFRLEVAALHCGYCGCRPKAPPLYAPPSGRLI